MLQNAHVNRDLFSQWKTTQGGGAQHSGRAPRFSARLALYILQAEEMQEQLFNYEKREKWSLLAVFFAMLQEAVAEPS